MKKGDYGYMAQYKKKHSIGVAIYAVLIIGLVLVGRLAKGEITIVAYVLAAVLSLPAAKHLVAVLMVIAFRPLQQKEVDLLKQTAHKLERGTALYDITLSSTEYIAFVPYMYLYQEQVYCLAQITAKISIDYVKQYVERILENAGLHCQVTVVHTVPEMNQIMDALKQQEHTLPEESGLLPKVKQEILIYNV